MTRAPRHELAVGLVLVVALLAFVALLIKAGTGPGFLSSRREIDVVFADGQGLRAGSPVRIAGLDVGQVIEVDLAELDGLLLARVRISLPEALAAKLRRDAKITIQSNITGQNCVNVVAAGAAEESLTPGQVVRGVETSFFDPILKEVGLGPAERSDISRSIAQVREAIDQAKPKVLAALGNVSETTATFKAVATDAGPTIQESLAHVKELTRRLEAQAPKIESALSRVDELATQVNGLVHQARPDLLDTIGNARDLSADVRDAIRSERPKVAKLLDGIDPIRTRLERVLYNSEVVTGQGAELMVSSRANAERAVANVRDATDWADQLVQKIYSNPFVLSPFYKPKPDDIRAQAVIDTARVFMKGAKELGDLVKTMEGMQKSSMSEQRRQEFDQLYRRATALMDWLTRTEQQLAEGLRTQQQQRR